MVVMGLLFLIFIGILKTRGEFGRKKSRLCPGETKEFVMKDSHMRGILNEGEKYKVIFNYYDCNPIRRDDLVLYQFSTQFEPVVKIARGIPGDKFQLKQDQKRKAWNLLINGEMLVSAVDRTVPYFFGAESPPTLSIYFQSRGGELKSGDVIALSSLPPGDSDSGVFGVASIRDILGRVELSSKHTSSMVGW